MANKKGVSSKINTQKQINDYANKNSQKSKTYQANKKTVNKKHKSDEEIWGTVYPTEWMYYSNPYDFD